MDNRVRFYSWLIPLLERRRMSFDEIADAWAEAGANPDSEELSLRTFHRYRSAIESQFGIIIECSGKADGYRYYIRHDSVAYNKVTEWMLSSLRLASLGEMLQYHTKVMLDTPPRHTEYLDDIMRAIDQQYLLRLSYTTAYGEPIEMELRPAFARYYRQRWYVIGMRDEEPDPPKHSTPDSRLRQVRCLPFDRIGHLDIVCQKHPLPRDMKQLLTPGSYFDGCYGIMRIDGEKPETIRIRAFYPEYNYIEEVPLHESQQHVASSPDGLYREYTLCVRPSRDFIQELLWHGRNIAVLQPESLRLKMVSLLRDMAHSYETGLCTNGEQSAE